MEEQRHGGGALRQKLRSQARHECGSSRRLDTQSQTRDGFGSHFQELTKQNGCVSNHSHLSRIRVDQREVNEDGGIGDSVTGKPLELDQRVGRSDRSHGENLGVREPLKTHLAQYVVSTQQIHNESHETLLERTVGVGKHVACELVEEREECRQELKAERTQRPLLSRSRREIGSLVQTQKHRVKHEMEEGGEDGARKNHTRRERVNHGQNQSQERSGQRIRLGRRLDVFQLVGNSRSGVGSDDTTEFQLTQNRLRIHGITGNTGEERADARLEHHVDGVMEESETQRHRVDLEIGSDVGTRGSVAKNRSEETEDGDEARNIGVQQSPLRTVGVEESFSLVQRVRHQCPRDMFGGSLFDELVHGVGRLLRRICDGCQ